MSDPPRLPDGPGLTDVPDDPGDARDDRLAALLAVEPLDDVTRRRLVRHALDGTAAGRRPQGRWLAAAAAAIAVVVAGTLALATGGGDEHRTAASTSNRDRHRRAGAATTTIAPSAPVPFAGSDTGSPGAEQKTASPPLATPTTASPDTAAAAPVAAVDLGPLGDVTDPATLRERVHAADDAAQATPTPVTTGFACAGALARARPELGPAEAIGTGTFHGAAVSVVVASRSDGTPVAVVVTNAGCVVHDPVTL